MPTKKVCERCGKPPEGKYDLLDYCAACSRDLCSACMEKGCCGFVPARSGEQADAKALHDNCGFSRIVT